MSYVIEPMTLLSFLDESNMKLPRFQRRATWTSKQNFELCISVFQEYPIGVVIVNKENSTSWLLDGRQRRNALSLMRRNPIDIYLWAQSYLKFNKTADSSEVTDVFWAKIAKYLQTDTVENSEGTENDETPLYEGEEELTEHSFNAETQRKGLNTLLDIIKMVHQIDKKGISSWERQFDYSDYFSKLKYAPYKNGERKIDPISLREFIIQLQKDYNKEYEGAITKEFFINYYFTLYDIKDGCENSFKEKVDTHWKDIEHCFDVIKRTEQVFADTRIGVIHLNNASPLDAQLIFSMTNSGGTQLRAEELLSAKPFWNIPVGNLQSDVTTKINELYHKLGIPTPSQIVRWDLPATLISRVDKDNLIFENYNSSKKKGTVSMDEITLGFKLVSSIYNSGMSARHVAELETNKELNWEKDINELAEEINNMISVLMHKGFFRNLQSWNMPITKLLGNAIALEFLTISYLNWKDKDSPMISSNAVKTFQRESIILFDRLVYEYATRSWRGSGDSKMSNDIKDWKNRIRPVSKSEWSEFIKESCLGEYNGAATTVKLLKPTLYYSYLLSNRTPENIVDIKHEVDHIIPKEKLNNNPMVSNNFKDSLSNLAVLSRINNNSKKSKALNEITDAWLKNMVKTYTGIDEKDFDKFSDVSNIDSLVKKRTKFFQSIFDADRDNFLSN